MNTIALLWLLQAAGPSQTAGEACPDDANAIVVCGHDHHASPRLPDLPVVPEQDSILPRADFKLFGDARMSFDAYQANVGGWQSPRIMATIKIPLGGKH